jgi:esterase/lipase superfamily enzyme
MAHSMGNRALIGALRRLQNHVDRPLIGREGLPKISQVVFAAADVKVADFIDLVEGFDSDSQDVPILTVYCTRDDLPLLVSHVHCKVRNQEDYPRLGNTQSCIDSSDKLHVRFVDVVDASGVGTTLKQHSNYCEAVPVLNDLKDIFRGGPRAANRQRLQQLNISRDFTDPFIMYTFNPSQFCRQEWKFIYELLSRR